MTSDNEVDEEEKNIIRQNIFMIQLIKLTKGTLTKRDQFLREYNQVY